LIDFDTIITLATTFFIIANPIGNSPAILTIVKDFSLRRQRIILLREGIMAILLALFFQFFGEHFLNLLMLKDYTIALCGGILLFLISIDLIFPDHSGDANLNQKSEPFFVPIATPLLAGPSLLTVVMLYSRQIPESITVSLGLCFAWVFVLVILMITPYLQKILGNKGITALEQLMGMILSMISTEMIVSGLRLFMQNIN